MNKKIDNLYEIVAKLVNFNETRQGNDNNIIQNTNHDEVNL